MQQNKNLTLLEKKVLQQMQKDIERENSESLQKKLLDEIEKLTVQTEQQIVKAKDKMIKHQLGLYCIYTENQPMFDFIMKWEFLYDYQKKQVCDWMAFENLSFGEVLPIKRYDSIDPIKIEIHLLKNDKVVDFEALEKKYRKRHGYEN